MKTKHLISRIDRDLVEAAIHEAELKTSGEICVMVHEAAAPDAVAVAQAEFMRLGMQKTKHRNAVLILVAPVSQTFALIGDEAVHQKCGDAFWVEVAAVMSGHFKRGEFTAGLVQGVERAGRLLAREFPRRPDDKNQLPDGVITHLPVI
jgi:uncharacterized membrane protein